MNLPYKWRFIVCLILLAITLSLVVLYLVFAEKTAQKPYISDNLLFLRATTGVLIGIEAQLWETAKKYGLDYDRFHGLAMCESTLNPNAKGKAGEIGIFQFLPSTFSYYAEKYEVGFSIHDTNHQIELATIMLSDSKASEWTCLY